MNVLGLFDGIHIFGDIFKTLSTSESYEEDAFLDESEEDETIFTLANERGELVALNGERCFIDHKVAGTEDLYDLVSVDGPEVIHFMLSGHDIGLM